MRLSSRISGLVLLVLLSAFAVPLFSQETVGQEITVSQEDNDEFLPAVAYDSVHDRYLVVFHVSSPLQGRWVVGKLFNASGLVLAEFDIAFEDSPPKDNAQAAAAFDPVNQRYLVTWVHDKNGDGSDYDIQARLIPWNGPSDTLQAFDVCTFTSNQWNPRTAYAGTQQEFLITWWNEGTGGVSSYVSAQRVSPSGGLLGSTITIASGTKERVGPDVAYNQSRNEYLIVYQLMEVDGGDIYAVRMNAGGSILGGGEFGVAAWPDPETVPSVAASAAADEWAVVWQSDSGINGENIYARRLWVDGSGTIQFAPPVEVYASGLDEDQPEISANPADREYMITWRKQYSDTNGVHGIFSRSLDTDNALGKQVEVRGISIYENTDCSNPGSASGNGRTFVVWEHDRDATPSYQDIHGRMIIQAMFKDGFESGDTGRWDLTASP